MAGKCRFSGHFYVFFSCVPIEKVYKYALKVADKYFIIKLYFADMHGISNFIQWEHLIFNDNPVTQTRERCLIK